MTGPGGGGRPARPVCVLVGPPGSGKSTVAALIARVLGVPARDTDTDVEQATGKPIGDIFIDDGEDHFRALERRAVARALTGFDGVVALGAGAIMDDGTRDLLTEHLVVYLSVELGRAAERIGLGAARPMLGLAPRATLRHLLEQRRALYEQVAVVTVPTDALTPDQVAATVVAALVDLGRIAGGDAGGPRRDRA